MKLEVAIETYLASTSGHASPNTIHGRRSRLNAFAEVVGPNLRVRHITSALIEDVFFTSGRWAAYAPSSYNNSRSVLKAFVQWLVRRGYVAHDVLDAFDIIRPRRQPRVERQRLTPRQIITLVENASNPRNRIILALLANTGARQVEVRTLKIGDVDLQTGSLHMSISKTQTEDTMPINSDLDMELRRWLMVYQERVGHLRKSYYLIPGMKHAHHFDSEILPLEQSTRLDRYVNVELERHGWRGERTGAHTLRRSTARAYYESLSDQGHDHALSEVAALLHHSSIKTTEAYIGADFARKKRDESLRGKPFLTGMIHDANVTSLTTREAESGN